LFGGFCLIYAVAHYTFPFSAIWDASWWFWHFLRLAACMLAFGYVLLAFLRSRRQIEQSNLALERRAEELSQSQIALERTNSALSREIEERRRAKAQLLELAADLKRSNLDLEDFAHVVSHDLKAPLRALSMIAKLTAEDYSDILDQAGKENLTQLVGQTERMGGLIDGVLRYSQVGHATSDPRIVDVGQLVHDVIAALNPPQHIAVRVEGTFPQVRYDATQLEQVFQNLISNAIKYQDKPQGEVVIDCRDESAHWAFCVRDTGMGIHERNWDQIFQLFHILHQRDERDASGVGLAVVKRIVERHRGVISVESVVGEGSYFTFTVPKSLPNGSKHP
jgi:light-regulated signal transduction histidine kinase (bacteriophytochrome)